MQFMALMYGDALALGGVLRRRNERPCTSSYRAFAEEASKAGVMAGGGELGSTRDATTVRVRNAETLVTDGPYAEVKEALGGYFLLECDSIEEAVDWAARIPGAEHGAIEVRPVLRRPERGRSGVMKYALLIYGDDSEWVDLSDEEKAELRAQEMPRWIALFDELQKADPNSTGHELDGRGTAKVVRVRNGEQLVTDGPFAETKEVVGGVFVVDLPDLDEAIRLAALIPTAEHGSLEIRPIVE